MEFLEDLFWGFVIFIIFVNDLDDNVQCKSLRFADDTKLIHPAKSIVERDLWTLYKWSVDWQMEFNVNKCSVIHFGNNNKEFEYNMNDDAIESSKEEKDLGVLIDKSL